MLVFGEDDVPCSQSPQLPVCAGLRPGGLPGSAAWSLLFLFALCIYVIKYLGNETQSNMKFTCFMFVLYRWPDGNSDFIGNCVCVWWGETRTESRDLCISGKCLNIELQPSLSFILFSASLFSL